MAMSIAALGATSFVVTSPAIVKFKREPFLAHDLGGGTMLDCRSEVVERFWNGGLALMFRLPKGRYHRRLCH